MTERAVLDDWQVTVHALSTLPPDRYRKPADGRTFVAVQLTLQNAAALNRYVMPERQMVLVDGEGQVYAPDQDAAVIAARIHSWLIPEGAFPPGATAQGAVSYQIPLGAQDLRWVFHAALYPGAPTVTFALGDAPQP
jgi:hypothetical protein